MTRSRLFFLFLLLTMIFFALSPGEITDFTGTGDDRHAFAFALLPLVSAIAWPRIPLTIQFLAYSALGGGIEIAQWIRRDWHTAEWDDWFTDMAAAAVALLIVAAVRRYRARRSVSADLSVGS